MTLTLPRPELWRGVDDSFANRTATQLKGAGYGGEGRYVSIKPNKKNITKGELDDNVGNGIATWLVWETTAGRALQGYQAGRDDASYMDDFLHEIGLPDSFWPCLACDTSVANLQPQLTAPYYIGAQEVRPGVGGYGPRSVMQYLLWLGHIKWVWQWGANNVGDGVSGNAAILQLTGDQRTQWKGDAGTDENIIMQEGPWFWRGTVPTYDAITQAFLIEQRQRWDAACSAAEARGSHMDAVELFGGALAVAAVEKHGGMPT